MEKTPVTVSIYRKVDPEHVDAVTRWVQAGVNMANKYPGYLGAGWIRTAEDSTEWQMLYRFADAESLSAWDDSDERRAWLAEGAHRIVAQQVEKRTGIEGWFDRPQRDNDAGDAPTTTPPRWKQSISIWLGFFPVNLVFTLLVTTLVPGWDAVNVAVKVLITTAILTPIMAYWVLPFVTRLLHPWLNR